MEHYIESHDGINAAKVDMRANTITVDYAEERYNNMDIRDLINQAGVSVDPAK